MQQIIIANIISGKLIVKHYRKEEEYFIVDVEVKLKFYKTHKNLHTIIRYAV